MLGSAIIALLTAIPSVLEHIGPLVARAKEIGEWTPEQEEQKRVIAEGYYSKHENAAPPPPPPAGVAP